MSKNRITVFRQGRRAILALDRIRSRVLDFSRYISMDQDRAFNQSRCGVRFISSMLNNVNGVCRRCRVDFNQTAISPVSLTSCSSKSTTSVSLFRESSIISGVLLAPLIESVGTHPMLQTGSRASVTRMSSILWLYFPRHDLNLSLQP